MIETSRWSGEPRLDWDDLYRRHAEELVRFAVKLLGDRERGADLAHETFVQAMRAEAQLRDAASVRPWLFRIAANRARNELRRRRLIGFLPFTGRERGPADAFDVEADMVHRALGAIPPDQAVALVLHHQQGFTRREVADLTGVGEEAVKSRLSRGRARFMAAYRRLERGLAR
ncbi:MAG: RNA polymerase sigma factor [Candidatus Limnocylindria bacterium]